MDKLDPVQKDSHDGQHVEDKIKQEYKFVGSSRRPHSGMKLYGLDVEKEEIYEVKIITEPVLDLKSKKPKMKSRADINPAHHMVWAINMKNATRKFMKLKFKV